MAYILDLIDFSNFDIVFQQGETEMSIYFENDRLWEHVDFVDMGNLASRLNDGDVGVH
jgi:hypothetical protein